GAAQASSAGPPAAAHPGPPVPAEPALGQGAGILRDQPGVFPQPRDLCRAGASAGQPGRGRAEQSPAPGAAGAAGPAPAGVAAAVGLTCVAPSLTGRSPSP